MNTKLQKINVVVVGALTAIAMSGIFVMSPVAVAAAATLYVSPTGSNTSNNCQTEATPCATIQYAIGQASSGDTIQVAAGSYPMGGFTITKSDITLEGANAGVNPNTGSRGAESVIDGYFNVASGDTINGFTFTQNTSANWGRVQFDNSTSSNVTVQDNIFTNVYNAAILAGDFGGTYSDIAIENNLINGVTGASQSGILAFGNFDNGSVISGNTIENVAYSGINTAGATDLTISNNTISTSTSQGIQVNSGTGNVSVTGNTITNANTSDTADGGGIGIYTGITGSLTITGNTISGSYNGVAVRNDSSVDISDGDITVSGNDLAGNSNAGAYVGSSAIGQLNAKGNWWGSATGPADTVSGDNSVPDTNPGGTGAAAVGAVIYSNWCTNSYCDMTRPTLTYNAPAANAVASDTLAVSVTASDAGSGIANVVVHVYNASSTLLGSCGSGASNLGGVSSYTYSCTLDVSSYADGDYTLKSGTSDMAGNNQTVSLPFVVNHEGLVITAPAVDGAYATGTYDFTAEYYNGATTNLDWAIREGSSCSTGTVAGDVDGFSNTSTLSGTDFSAVLDTTQWTDGDYCFVVNDLHGLRRTRLFMVDNTAPTAPTLVSPPDGATVSGASVTQTWSDSDPSVDHFVYQSFNDASATSLRWQQTFSSSTFSKTATNVASSTYWWRVEAFDAAGNMSASPLWKLIVKNATYVTTNAATGITQYDATLNGTNGDYAATGHSFWVSTSSFSTASPNIPAGVYSTPDLGAIASGAAFSASLSSLTSDAVVSGGAPGTMPSVTPNTAYYYVAWSLVSGTWHPGTIQTFTTGSLNDDATLSALGVSQGTLSPPFDPGVTSYTDVLPHDATNPPTVTATTTDPNATVAIVQATSTTGTATVTVTAQNGTTTQNYTVLFSLAPVTTSMLTVYVSVDNSAGGNATSSDFNVTVFATHASKTSFSGDAGGTPITIDPSTPFHVNVSHLPHYDQSTSGNCNDSSGLPAGGSAVCTVTETYRPSHGLTFMVGGPSFPNGHGGEVLGAAIGGNEALLEQLQYAQQQFLALLQQYLTQLHSHGIH